MWKTNGKTATLLLFLDSRFPKTETNVRCFLWRNCLLKHVIEGKIDRKREVTRRRGRRCKKALDDITKKRGYWTLTEEHYIALCGELAL
jgi:hypothetical protein